MVYPQRGKNELHERPPSLRSRLVRDEEGATAVEYGVIATGIFLACLGAITLFAGNAVNMWNSIAAHI
jgi:Flp pilus assembly pilin Flp